MKKTNAKEKNSGSAVRNFRAYLPNLQSLIAFEASARHESFALAGDELNLTQSAVSHRVRTLEESLELELFTRSHRSIELNPSGVEYYNSVVIALRHLAAVGESIKGARKLNSLNICSNVAFHDFWLKPRLNSLMQAFPDTRLNLISTDIAEEWFSADYDIALVLGNGKWPGFDAIYLFDEEIFPVCSPSYPAGNEAVISLDEIGNAKLIDLSFEKTEWLNWTIWFTEMGHPRSNLDIVFKSNSYSSVIETAINGNGFALGWSYIVSDLIRDKNLIASRQHSVKTGHAYYLVHKAADVDQIKKINVFANWFMQQLK